MHASAHAPVAIAALTQDRALIGLLRSVVDPATELLFVNSEEELAPQLAGRRVSVAMLDCSSIEGDLAQLAERLRSNWNDLVLIVVGTAEEQSKVASQITSGVVYRFLHRPVSAPRVRLFVEAALRRHEVEYVERTLEQERPDFTKLEAAKTKAAAKVAKARARADDPFAGGPKGGKGLVYAICGVLLCAAIAGAYFAFSGGPPAATTAEVDSPPAARTQPAAESAAAPDSPRTMADPAPPAGVQTPPPAAVQTPAAAAPAATAPAPSVADTLRAPPANPIQQLPEESAAQAPPAPQLTHEQLLAQALAQAESALQRGELASPPGRSAVDLFRGALDLDPSNTLAKAGLVRVADRLLSAAERSLTAGNPEDARKMVDVAESLTPATARGAFLMMQIEMEHERAALVRASEAATSDKAEKGATYLRLANSRIRSGQLIEPSEDNARFYLEAARQVLPDDPGVADTSRALQKELLAHATTAADAGNAAETERWLAYADGAGAGRPEMAGIRRGLQTALIGERADRMTTLVQSFTTALGAAKLLEPAEGSAKAYLLQMINTEPSNPAVATARQNLGGAYLRELHAALAREDFRTATAWLNEARTISYAKPELDAAEGEINDASAAAAARNSVVGANSLARIEYVPPKFPTASHARKANGWVEVEFTVRTDGSTGDIVVTNSNPRRLFDTAATNAIAQWRYKPVLGRDGKPIEQRAAVRIRFAEE